MRMQPKLSLLVHKLQNGSISNLHLQNEEDHEIKLVRIENCKIRNPRIEMEEEESNLDAFGGSGGGRCGGGSRGRRREGEFRIEGEEEEESESEESESHEEEQCDEPVLLPDRKLRFRAGSRFPVNDPGRPGLWWLRGRRRRWFSSREALRVGAWGSHGSTRVTIQIGEGWDYSVCIHCVMVETAVQFNGDDANEFTYSASSFCVWRRHVPWHSWDQLGVDTWKYGWRGRLLMALSKYCGFVSAQYIWPIFWPWLPQFYILLKNRLDQKCILGLNIILVIVNVAIFHFCLYSENKNWFLPLRVGKCWD